MTHAESVYSSSRLAECAEQYRQRDGKGAGEMPVVCSSTRGAEVDRVCSGVYSGYTERLLPAILNRVV